MTKTKLVAKAIAERRRHFFSLEQIVEDTRLERRDVEHVIEKMVLCGLIRRVSSRPQEEYIQNSGRPRHSIIFQVADLMAIRRKSEPKLRENTAADRMWKVIRYKRCFTLRELVTIASVTREHARWYLKQLRREGIVSKSRRGGPGVEWTLAKDPGPRRPPLGRMKREQGL